MLETPGFIARTKPPAVSGVRLPLSFKIVLNPNTLLSSQVVKKIYVETTYVEVVGLENIKVMYSICKDYFGL